MTNTWPGKFRRDEIEQSNLRMEQTAAVVVVTVFAGSVNMG